MHSRILLTAFLLPLTLGAQGHKPNYSDLVVVRNRPWTKPVFTEIRAGALYGFNSGEDKARFAEDEIAVGGSIYHRSEQAFGRKGRLDAYVGNDGFYGSLTEGDPKQGKGYSRLEFYGHQWSAFGREGYYKSGDFFPTGIYERTDWRARLSFATQVTQTVKGEIGPFGGENRFSRNSQTDPNYLEPDNHYVYGVHLKVEEATLQYDQATLLPYRGYIFSIWVENEWNESNRLFGTVGSRRGLPDSLVRGGAHLEYYWPYTNDGTFIISADGAWSPEDDRIYIYSANKPIGEMWVDARLDYRMLLGDHITLTPGGRIQWLKLADQLGTATETQFFWGLQLEARIDFSESFSIVSDYSYLTNASREPVNYSKDSLGEHRLFVGIEFRPQ